MTSIRTAAPARVLGWMWPSRPRLTGRSWPGIPTQVAQAAALTWHGRRLFPWTQRVSWTHLLTLIDPRVPFADFELCALRATWNAGGYDEWALHNFSDRLLLGTELVERVYVGPTAPEWDERRAAVLRAVDELHDDLAVSPDTWAALGEWYDDVQRLELVLIAGMYELLSVCLRSIGTPRFFPSLGSRDPRAAASGPRRRRNPGPESERHRPAHMPERPRDLRVRADPGLWQPVDSAGLDVVRAQLPRHYRVFASAARPAAHPTLPTRAGHLAVLRTLWRDGPRREWEPRVALAAEAGIDDDTFARIGSDDPGPHDHDGAVLRAVDEVDTESCVTDRTWARLAEELSPGQRIELCFLIAHHRLHAMFANSIQ